MPRPHILLVDNNLADVEAMRQAFIDYWPDADLHVMWEGSQAQAAFASQGGAHVAADLILLDLHLTSVHGRDLLALLKRNPAFRRIPVVVLTSTDDPVERDACLAAGADRFITKPRTFRALAPLLEGLRGLIAARVGTGPAGGDVDA